MFKNVPHFKTKCGNENAERKQFRDYLFQLFINSY